MLRTDLRSPCRPSWLSCMKSTRARLVDSGSLGCQLWPPFTWIDGSWRWTGRLPAGAVALIVPVARSDGSKAVLKLQPVDDETGGEPAALQAWAGRGAVRLLEHDPDSGAMLLERLDASRDLSTMEDDLAAAQIIAELLVQLNSVPAPAGMRQLSDVAAATLAGAPEAVRLLGDAGRASALDQLRGPVPRVDHRSD